MRPPAAEPETCELVAGCGCGPSEPVRLADWWRVGVGIVIAANAMTLSLAVNTSEATPEHRLVIHGVLAGLAAACLAILGWPLARNAWRAARARRVTVEAMFLAGIVGALTASTVAAVGGPGEVYFEIVCILLVVYTLGQQLTAHAQQRALDAAGGYAPETAVCTVVGPDGTTREAPVAAVAAGDRVLVAPGASIPVDGVVEDGAAFVREAEMTGELQPVARRTGDAVWAGTQCLDASLVVRATAAGGHRRIDRIVAAVERARSEPSALERQADRWVARLLPAVLTVATVTFGLWWWLDSLPRGLFNAMAVLLVACPCALGLATPIAVWATVARLASRGLAARGGDVVEALAAVDAAVFDKTGTLTEARAVLVDVVVDPPAGIGREEVLAAVAAVERTSRHPVAAALTEAAPEGAPPVAVRSVEVVPAAGLRARVVVAGKELELVVGAADRLPQLEDQGWRPLRERLGGTTTGRDLAVLMDGVAVAAARVDERLRASWPAALEALRGLGIRTLVMTGDSAERARLTAADEVEAALGPEDKLARVQALRAAGRTVLFVGDGVNDAAAMAASDVAIGVATGSELATEVGEIEWRGDDLRAVPWAIETARSAISTLRGNFAFAISYNIVGIALAVGGVLHPVAAAVLMTCSSLVVTWRATSVLQAEQEERVAASLRRPAPAGEAA